MSRFVYLAGLYISLFFFFFFQAEDGIRDHCVTGVQTCALPISCARRAASTVRPSGSWLCSVAPDAPSSAMSSRSVVSARSEERRVGKECRSRWAQYDEKKKERTVRRADDYLCDEIVVRIHCRQE